MARGRPARHAARRADGVRQLWRYPNRRLYDPIARAYTNARSLSGYSEPFIVIDSQTGVDITASVLASAEAMTLRADQDVGTPVVYFIRSGEDGPIKIGLSSTNKVEQRVGELQVGSASRLRLIGFVSGDRDSEQFLHRCFAALGIGGEWFRADPSLLAFVETTLKSGALEHVPRAKPLQLSLATEVIPNG